MTKKSARAGVHCCYKHNRAGVGECSRNARDCNLAVFNRLSKRLHNISAEFGYHSYHLNKLFKDNMGTTIHQALINERVSIAKHLLRTTMLSIEDVAREVGFAERAQFCTVFKKHTGKTPGAYRGAKRNPKQP